MENGLDRELGFEEEEQKELECDSEKSERPKRKQFYEWIVKGKIYKMKLNSSMICKLEEKFRTNLLDIISQGGIPPLYQMLTIAQGAIAPWHHGISYKDVQKLFDAYVSEGGNQITFYSEVIMGMMAVSGFFTEDQAKEITESLKEDTAEL